MTRPSEYDLGMDDKRLSIEGARARLRIDPDDLDACLTEHPDIYYHVADEHALAIADRDQAQLELDELMAELSDQLRKKALKDEEKVTDKSVEARLLTLPKVQEAKRAFLTAKADVGRWAALKEGFEQRSYMLKSLVERQIAHLHSLGLERSGASSRASLGQATVERVKAARREGGGRPRFRPAG